MRAPFFYADPNSPESSSTSEGETTTTSSGDTVDNPDTDTVPKKKPN